MATITIRNVDDAVHQQLKRDAKANHRSLEAEARARIARDGARAVRPEIDWPEIDWPEIDWAEVTRRVALDPGPDYEGSVALIRALRDER